MSYSIYIIRRNDYRDFLEESKITLEEWLNYAESDTELQPSTVDDEPGSFDWYGHPRSDADTIPLFTFSFNSIESRYLDKYTISKMIRMAKAMNAKMIDADQRYYDETFFTNGGYPLEE